MKKSSLPNFRSICRKHTDLPTKETVHNGTVNCFVKKFEDEQDESDRWRDGALKSDEDALHFETLLLIVVLNRYQIAVMRPRAHSKGRRLKSTPSVFTQVKLFALRRTEPFWRKMKRFGGNTLDQQRPRHPVSRTQDPKMESQL